MYKAQDWIPMNIVIVPWMHSTKLKPNFVIVQGYQIEKVSILVEQYTHFRNHLFLLYNT
jgi:hypothetical protein